MLRLFAHVHLTRGSSPRMSINAGWFFRQLRWDCCDKTCNVEGCSVIATSTGDGVLQLHVQLNNTFHELLHVECSILVALKVVVGSFINLGMMIRFGVDLPDPQRSWHHFWVHGRFRSWPQNLWWHAVVVPSTTISRKVIVSKAIVQPVKY